MSKLLDDAIEVLRDLPQNVQEAAARAIMDYAATFDYVQLSDAKSRGAWIMPAAASCR